MTAPHDRHFGHLRSQLHGEPSRTAWRRICRLVERAEDERAADQLVPYADTILDRGWPDALRTASYTWHESLKESGVLPRSWPLVRALTSLPSDAATLRSLAAERALARITHVELSTTVEPDTLRALLDATSLSHLHYGGRGLLTEMYAPLITQHPDLTHLSLECWGYPQTPLDLRFEGHQLGQLRTLHMIDCRLSAEAAASLLRAQLPALRDLSFNLIGQGEPPVATPRWEALERLALRFDAAAHLTALQALSNIPALDALHLRGPLTPPAAALLLPIPSPRSLTLEDARMSAETILPLANAALLSACEEVSLRNAVNVDIAPLCHVMRRQVARLSLLNTHSGRLGAALTAAPWPALTALALDTCSMDGLDAARLASAWPALTSLQLCNVQELGPTLPALCDAPWFYNLQELSLLNSRLPGHAHLELLGALHRHPALRLLNLTSTTFSATRLDQLTRTELPKLTALHLGRVDGLTMRELELVCAASWLPQLDELRLNTLHRALPEDVRRTNLRSLLISHGAKPTIHVAT